MTLKKYNRELLEHIIGELVSMNSYIPTFDSLFTIEDSFNQTKVSWYSLHRDNNPNDICPNWMYLEDFILDVGLKPELESKLRKIDKSKICTKDNYIWIPRLDVNDVDIRGTYQCWADMKRRCDNPNMDCYTRYGGRGITYCNRWKVFHLFLEDMGIRPEGLTLERINNELGYYKENCKWATRKEQQNNQRGNTYYRDRYELDD